MNRELFMKNMETAEDKLDNNDILSVIDAVIDKSISDIYIQEVI